MPPCLHTLCVGRTPGEQRIHRAELFAIVWICERFHNVAIHTDSTVALAAIRACKQERACFQHMEDLDLILRLQQVIHLGNKTFLKVQAHAEHARDVTWMTLFHRLGNKCANDAAIVANKILQPDAVTDFESMHTDLETHRQHLQKLFLSICKLLSAMLPRRYMKLHWFPMKANFLDLLVMKSFNSSLTIQ